MANKSLQKGWWSAQEDQKLAELVVAQGPRNWETIAIQLGSRSAMQCRQRWVNYIQPGVRKDGWTPEEDALIVELVKEFGPKWSKIRQSFPGRTDNAIKNHYVTLVRYGLAPAPATWRTTTQVIVKQHASSTRTYPNQPILLGSSTSSPSPEDVNFTSLLGTEFTGSEEEDLDLGKMPTVVQVTNTRSRENSLATGQQTQAPELRNNRITKPASSSLLCPTSLQHQSQHHQFTQSSQEQKSKHQSLNTVTISCLLPTNPKKIPELKDLIPEIFNTTTSSNSPSGGCSGSSSQSVESLARPEYHQPNDHFVPDLHLNHRHRDNLQRQRQKPALPSIFALFPQLMSR